MLIVLKENVRSYHVVLRKLNAWLLDLNIGQLRDLIGTIYLLLLRSLIIIPGE